VYDTEAGKQAILYIAPRKSVFFHPASSTGRPLDRYRKSVDVMRSKALKLKAIDQVLVRGMIGKFPVTSWYEK